MTLIIFCNAIILRVRLCIQIHNLSKLLEAVLSITSCEEEKPVMLVLPPYPKNFVGKVVHDAHKYIKTMRYTLCTNFVDRNVMDLCKQACNLLQENDDTLMDFFESLSKNDRINLLRYVLQIKQKKDEATQRAYRRKTNALGMSATWYYTSRNEDALERKRAYDREYKRKQRAHQSNTQTSENRGQI